MNRSNAGSLDLVEEIRLRRWARESYVPPQDRNPDWHPVVLHEMRCKDQELQTAAEFSSVSQIVPLHPDSFAPDGFAPDSFTIVHAAHTEVPRTNLLLSVPAVTNDAMAQSPTRE